MENLQIAKRDTVKIINGQFKINGFIKEPKHAYLEEINSNNNTELWIETGIMHIDLERNNFHSFKLSGSKSQIEQNEYDKMAEPVIQNQDKIYTKLKQINTDIDNTNDEKIKKELSEKYNKYKVELTDTKSQILNTQLQFIKSNPQSYISTDMLFILVEKVADDETHIITTDSLAKIYTGLARNVQNSFVGQFTKKNIDKIYNNRIGSPAPDFSVPDINRQLITLSSFKGKSVVLMDFWASWCGHCREDFKWVKPIYNRLHKKGFDIIAIDMDYNDKNAWLTAINKDGISMWHNVPVAENYCLNYTENDIYTKYFVWAIPRKILIDKNGIIVGNWDGSTEEIEKEVTLKIEELVNK